MAKSEQNRATISGTRWCLVGHVCQPAWVNKMGVAGAHVICIRLIVQCANRSLLIHEIASKMPIMVE